MKTEYEAKFLDIDESLMRQRLRDIGAVCLYPSRLMTRMTFENSLMTAHHGWVRLRDEGGKVTLAYKSVQSATTIDGTQEIEVIVSDMQATAEFLEHVGVTRKNYQENYREEWRFAAVTITLDRWPGIPTFLEIEGTDEKSVKEVAALLHLDYRLAKFGSIDTLYLEVYGRNILQEPELTFTSQQRVE